MNDLFGEVIHSYTRADALADGSLIDGSLIDVSTMAKEAGFKFPVAMTSAAFNGYVVPAASDAKNWGQDIEGRLWDVFTMLKYYTKSSAGGSRVDFQVIFRIKGRNKTVLLKSLCHPGDSMEPVITIMLPEED